MTQGRWANRQGSILEQHVAQTFTDHGFVMLTHAAYVARGNPDGDFLLTNAPYTSIYGHTGKTEFLAISTARDLGVRIECKWQQSSGSVDEKFPYLYLNCIECMPENEIILLIDGRGYKPGALAWLKQAVRENRYCRCPKNIHVMDLAEFIAWANLRLR